MITEVSVMNEVLRRVVAVERRLAELDDRASTPDSSATQAVAVADQAAAVAGQAVTDLADHERRLGQIESDIGSALTEASAAAQDRIEVMGESYRAALQAVVDDSPSASLTRVVRDQVGRIDAVVTVGGDAT